MTIKRGKIRNGGQDRPDKRWEIEDDPDPPFDVEEHKAEVQAEIDARKNDPNYVREPTHVDMLQAQIDELKARILELENKA